MTAQTAWRRKIPAYCATTGAFDPRSTELRQMLERGEPVGPDGTMDFRRRSMRVVPRLSDPVTTANGGSHIFTLRKHTVVPGTGMPRMKKRPQRATCVQTIGDEVQFAPTVRRARRSGY